jgi:hypothetical protein
MTLSIMTVCIAIKNATLSIMIFSIMTLSITTLSIAMKKRDTQRNGIQHNNTGNCHAEFSLC